MEQHLGHRTFYENLRNSVDRSSGIDPLWNEITYVEPESLWERLPMPQGIKGAMTGRSQVLRGLRQAYDIALFNTQVPAALGGSAIFHKPYILCTDITPLQYDRMGAEYHHQPDGDNPFSRYKHGVNRRLFQRAARILPWSHWTGDSLVKDYGADPGRIEVIPPGVDLQRWKPCLHPSDGRVRILFVGGDFTRKGGQMLLEAYRSLSLPQAELVLVTRTELPSEEGVRVYNTLTPNSPELLELYQSCDVFVLPTRAEAFGIAAVEASACGLPVIASHVGGLPDIVQHGETGFLIPPGSVSALAETLNRIAADAHLRQELGQHARAHAEQRFDAQKNAARIITILLERAQPVE